MKSLDISIFPECGISVSAKIAIYKNGFGPKITMLNVKWMEYFFHPFLIPKKRPVCYTWQALFYCQYFTQFIMINHWIPIFKLKELNS